MSFEALEAVSDVSVGGWIAPRLCGFGGRVCAVAPRGFDGYVRVLHPATGPNGEPTTWADVCRSTGRSPHALMQWSTVGGDTWRGEAPQAGNLPLPTLTALADVLADFTPLEAQCYHAVWEGWGWLHRGAFSVLRAVPLGQPATPVTAEPGLPDAVMAIPRLRHPNRDYLLFRGPLSGAFHIGHQVTESWFIPQSPSLLWPADRSWIVASEIDFDSTLVAGSQELIAALLSAPDLETWQVMPEDDLSTSGDRING